MVHALQWIFLANLKYTSEHYCPEVYLLTTLCIAKQNLSNGINVVSKGAPSRMRMVRRISFGITTLPRSSMRRTIPVHTRITPF